MCIYIYIYNQNIYTKLGGLMKYISQKVAICSLWTVYPCLNNILCYECMNREVRAPTPQLCQQACAQENRFTTSNSNPNIQKTKNPQYKV